MKEFFKTFFSYIKRHFALLIAFALAVIIFSVVFELYSLPFEAVVYSSILTALALTILAIIRFYSYYKKHKILVRMRKTVEISIDELPASGSLIENDYQQLLTILNKNKIDCVSAADMQLSDMMEYYAMWVHQIKTPIAAMRLLLQTENSDYNAELDEQLFRIEQYVEMVMQYLRTQSNSSDLIIKEYKLDDIVKQAVRKYRKQFIRKKLTINLENLDTFVLTDEKWLLFVVEQILSNSLKYTSDGSISVYTDNNNPYLLVIEDTGIGIREEDLPRIFERGFTGYNGRKDKKSTGIGLYLCKRVLTELGHTISVSSEVGHGTAVNIGFVHNETKYE